MAEQVTTGKQDSEASELAELPRIGELDPGLAASVADGQPLLLTHRNHPFAVLVDVDSWCEITLATAAEGA